MIPELPPREGYVEVEIDGIRQYEKISTEKDIKIQDLQESLNQQESINASLMIEIAKIKAGVLV